MQRDVMDWTQAKLNPEIAQVLGWVRNAAHRPYHLLTPTAARSHYERIGANLDYRSVNLAEVRDFAIELPGRQIRARLYSDSALSWVSARPVVLYFHGGGFVIGSIDTHDALCRKLASLAPAAVLSIDYRLAPEARFPSAADDAIDCMRWLVSEAQSLGLDAGRVVVSGDSAGGTLAAVVARQAAIDGVRLAGQLLVYPGTGDDQNTASHWKFSQGFLLDRSTILWFFSHYLGATIGDDPGPVQRRDWRFAPLVAPQQRFLAPLAPAAFILADHDPLFDEGLDYAERLKREGAEVEVEVFEGTVHAFWQMGGALQISRSAHAYAASKIADFVGS